MIAAKVLRGARLSQIASADLCRRYRSAASNVSWLFNTDAWCVAWMRRAPALPVCWVTASAICRAVSLGVAPLASVMPALAASILLASMVCSRVTGEFAEGTPWLDARARVPWLALHTINSAQRDRVLRSIELKGDRPRFVRSDLFMHPARIHVRPIGPDHHTQIEVCLIEEGLVLERFKDPASRGRQNG